MDSNNTNKHTFCNQCGTKLNENARFCHSCGSPVLASEEAFSEAKWEYCQLIIQQLPSGMLQGILGYYKFHMIAEGVKETGTYVVAASNEHMVNTPIFIREVADGKEYAVNQVKYMTDEIVPQLLKNGWTMENSQGANWWEKRFKRKSR